MLKYLYLCILFFPVSSISWAQSSTELDIQKSLNLTSSIVTPFTAKYSILHKSKQVGTGIRQLDKLTNNTFRYSYETDIEWLIFDDQRKEESEITLSDNTVIPTHYKYTRTGTGRDKFYEWAYDTTNNTAINIKKGKTTSVQYPENIQDSLSYHLQHRLNLINNPTQKHFAYHVIKSSGKISEYIYEYDGEEEIMLPYGLVKTIKLKREIKEKEKITYAWFAPELNYLLVRLYQIKGGTEQFEAQLTTLVTK